MKGGLMDGLTTNGVLIHHTDDQNLTWRELSVEGAVYTLRETRSHAKRGQFCPEFDNVLRDGTLIDLCGATLLWRSASRIQNMPNMAELGKHFLLTSTLSGFEILNHGTSIIQNWLKLIHYVNNFILQILP